MRKAIAVCIALTLGVASFAQTETTPSKPAPSTQTPTQKDDQTLKFVSGKVMTMRDGNWVALTEDRTLTNGTIVATNGWVTKKDGTKVQLKEGESIDKDGKILPAAKLDKTDEMKKK